MSLNIKDFEELVGLSNFGMDRVTKLKKKTSYMSIETNDF
jgi:hypothetical protein